MCQQTAFPPQAHEQPASPPLPPASQPYQVDTAVQYPAHGRVQAN